MQLEHRYVLESSSSTLHAFILQKNICILKSRTLEIMQQHHKQFTNMLLICQHEYLMGLYRILISLVPSNPKKKNVIKLGCLSLTLFQYDKHLCCSLIICIEVVLTKSFQSIIRPLYFHVNSSLNFILLQKQINLKNFFHN